MATKNTKAMTVRLSERQAAELEALARVENIPVSEAIRDALARRIAEVKADRDFQARLERIMEEHRATFELLAER